MEEILSLAQKVTEAAEVFRVTSEDTSVQFETNRLKHIQGKQSTSITLRVVKDGRIGNAIVAGDIDKQKLVDMAVETARFGMPARFEFPAKMNFPEVEIYDRDVETVTAETLIHPVEELIGKITAHTPAIQCGGGAGRSVFQMELMNSRGGTAAYRKTVGSLGIEGTLIRGTDMLFVGDGESSCHPVLDTKKIGDLVLEQLELARNLATVATKTMPVLFTPNGIASAFVSPLVAAFNGKMVLEGASPIGQRRGQKVFDPKLCLWDDAVISFRPETRPCDDEGIPSRRTPLIENGTIANFYYDLQTAGLAGTASTGNGSRGRGTIGPAPSSFIIEAGNTGYADMLADMKEGLVVEQLMGAEQGNVLGGDFNGNVLLGFKVENGKITGRVKDTMVSGNIYQVLREIHLSRETRWMGALSAPYMLCPGIAVASK